MPQPVQAVLDREAGEPLADAHSWSEQVGGDVGSARVVTGAGAAEAAASLGARAFTVGNRVFFGAGHDVETDGGGLLLHELAHVAQQRGASKPASWSQLDVVDRDDAREVAAREHHAGGSSDMAIARDTGDAQPTTHAELRKMLERYLPVFRVQLWQTIGARFRALTWPEPDARIALHDQAFTRALLIKLESSLGDFLPLSKLDAVLYPQTAVGIFGALLPKVSLWRPAIGLVAAQELQIAVAASIKRSAAGILAVADSTGSDALDVSDVVVGSPLDRYVTGALVARAAIDITPLSDKKATAARGKNTKLRSIKVTAEGAHHPELWAWVRAEPNDATAAEVANTLWGDNGDLPASTFAHRLEVAPPLFGLPPAWASTHQLTKPYAPANGKLDGAGIDAVVRSGVGDELALAQNATTTKASTGSGTAASAIATTSDCEMQLLHAISNLSTWHVASRATPALTFVLRKRAELATMTDAAAAPWAHVLTGQSERLSKIAGGIHQLTETITKVSRSKRVDVTSPALAPMRQVIDAYATAAATSHMATTSQRELEHAMQLQSALQTRAMQASELDLYDAYQGIAQTTSSSLAFGDGVAHLRDRSQKLQTDMINTGRVDPDEAEDVELRSEEAALRMRLVGTMRASNSLAMAAVKVKDGIAAHAVALFSGKYNGLGAILAEIEAATARAQRHLIDGLRPLDAAEATATPAAKRLLRTQRRLVVSEAREELKKLSADHDLQHFFEEAQKTIADFEFRTALVRLGITIAIAVAAMFTAGVAAEFIAGSFAEAEGIAVASLSLGQRFVVGAVQGIVEAAINSAAQLGLSGGELDKIFLENLIMSAGNLSVLGQLGRDAEIGTTLAEQASHVWWKKGARWLIKTPVTLTAHTLWGAALGYTASLAVEHKTRPEPKQLRDWMLDGAAIAVGRFVHASIGERMPGLQRLAQRTQQPQLVEVASQLQLRATTLESSKSADEAVALLAERTKLMQDEVKALDRDIALHGDTSGELAKTRSEVREQLAELHSNAIVDVRLHLLGLEELVPNALWRGTPEQVKHAVEEARRTEGAEVSHDAATNRWSIRAGDRVLELREVGGSSAARTASPVDSARIAGQMRTKGHSGIEVHSHFMGNVDPIRFREELAASGVAPMTKGDPTATHPADIVGDVSAWEPLLRKVAQLDATQLAHDYSDAGTITGRGSSGDAVKQAKDALIRIDQLKQELGRGKRLTDERRAELVKQIDDEAHSSINKALRASDETDFNSSYEVRDEFVKTFYGTADRNRVLPAGTSLTASKAKLVAHFKGRPVVMERLDRALALEAKQASGSLTPAESTELGSMRKSIDTQFGYDTYTIDTLVRLAQDHITYTEQSNSVKKMSERFDPEQLAWAKEQAKLAHPDLAAQLEALVVKHIAMIPTMHFGARDAPDQSDIRPTTRSSDKAFKDDVARMVKLAERSDTVGGDIAGPEFARFDALGEQRLEYMYDQLGASAVKIGHPLSFRPHVGEGANDTVAGVPYGRDHSRQVTADGKLTHYARANANIEAMLRVLERIAARPENAKYGGRLPPEVIVRFGHATHTDPNQAIRMAKLGVIAEVNLVSNSQTGSSARDKPEPGRPDKVVTGMTPKSFDDDQANGTPIGDHSLESLVFNEVEVILSTDAHSVMNTTLGNEYSYAAKRIEAVITGKAAFQITAAQARAMNSQGGKVRVDASAGPVATVEVTYKELSPSKRLLFDDAMRTFYETANRYRIEQGKPQ